MQFFNDDNINNIIEQREKGYKDLDISNSYELICKNRNLFSHIYTLYNVQFFNNYDIKKNTTTVLVALRKSLKQSIQNARSKYIFTHSIIEYHFQNIKVRIFSFYYAIGGYFFSKMYNWDCIVNVDTDQIMTINPSVYSTISVFASQTLNMSFLYCSQLWIKLWIMKVTLENKQYKILFAKCLKIVTLFLLIICIPTALILTIISEFYNLNYARQFLFFATLINSVIFIIVSCILLVSLKDHYNVGGKYKKNLKIIIFVVTFCVIFRCTLNFIQYYIKSFDQSFLGKLKNGCLNQNNKRMLPDQSYNWSLFSFVYILITDFLPIVFISTLFSPNYTPKKALVKISSGWDSIMD